MNKKPLLYALSITLCSTSLALADDVEVLDKIEVTTESKKKDVSVQLLPENAQSIIDTSEVLKKMAGANVNRNGPLTGIAQYRGLSGSRVNVQIDGANMQESCSNSMDAVMSHVPASMIDAVVLKRGIAPVSSGIETIGGSIFVIPKTVNGTSEKMEYSADFNLGYTSVNAGAKASALLSASSATHNYYLGVDSESGESYAFDGGENFNTEYERKFYLLGYNFNGEKHSFAFKYNYNDTGESGTPSLPMDIVYAQGGVASVDYGYEISDNWNFRSKFSHQNTDHVMSNYLFRNVVQKKDSITQVNSNAYSFVLDTTTQVGELSFGIEGDDTNHQADIVSPDNSMFHIDNFDTEKDRNSFFIELLSDLNDMLSFSTGLRYTKVDMYAIEVNSSVAMMDNPMGNMHRMRRDAFNTADRNIEDNNLDFSLNLTHKINDTLVFDYGIGYKTRSPSYQERYLWLPLEATAGMADGFNYLGNLDLETEKATQFELGLTYKSDHMFFSPHVFYHRINDYIQGTPTPMMNVLQHNNVDAELYGADIEFSYQITNTLSLNNTTSYVRGQRRDINDNLYRIAPLNTRFELVYSHSDWNFSTELSAYQAQEKVSLTNLEQSTPGYGLTNVAATYTFNDRAKIAFGVNNLFDKKYTNHLNGYNRNNKNTDVGFEANNPRAFRLPGEGINSYVTLYLHW